MINRQIKPTKNQRVITFLNRDEVDFLDKFGKDALFSTGLKLSRAKVIAWLVEFIKELNMNGDNIKSEKDFENRLLEVMGRPALGGVKGSVPSNQFPPATARIKTGGEQ